MQTPLSFCDITARFGQTPAPQKSIAEQTGWNPNQLFRAIEAAGADKKGKKKSAKTEEKVDAFQAGAIQIPESKPTEPVSPAEETAPAPIEAPVETEEIEVEVEEIEVEVDADENKEG